MSKNDGGPAFPYIEQNFEGRQSKPAELSGMSLRDYFAAAALTGLMSNADWFRYEEQNISERAYLIADAMLSAREAE